MARVTRARSLVATPQWALTGVLETFIPSTLSSGGPLTSGRLTLVGGIVIPAGRAINTISFFSSTTAASVPLNQWFCLTDLSRTVLAKTVDDTTTAWAANTKKSLALTATYTPTADIAVYVGIVVVATTVPSLSSVAVPTAIIGSVPIRVGSSTTGLTDPASLSGTPIALTAAGQWPYVQVS